MTVGVPSPSGVPVPSAVPGPEARTGTRRSTALQGLPAHVKLLGALGFVVGVVATPRTAVPVFAVDALAIASLAAIAGLRAGEVLRRMTVEVPFVAFALLLPFVARGSEVAVGPLSLSVDGLWAAWGIVAKATLGVGVAVLLSATTPSADLLTGAQRLRVPPVLTAIAGFMVRYGEVLLGELERLRIARIARGDDPRWIWQARAVALTAGTLFVRAFERGERVQLAMVARGFDGSWPLVRPERARPGQWAAAVAFVAVSVSGALVAHLGLGGLGGRG